MKLFIKLIVLALVLSYASLFVIRNPDGTPIRTLDSLIPSFNFSGTSSGIGATVNSLLTVFNNESNEATNEESASNREVAVQTREIYRWQDEQGTWHYTDTPPPGVNAEVMALQAPTIMNLNPSTATDDQPEANDQSDVVTAENETSLLPERFREMQNTLQQAEEVSEQFQERMEQQQRILEEL